MPRDEMVETLLATIDAEISKKNQEITEFEKLRAYIVAFPANGHSNGDLKLFREPVTTPVEKGTPLKRQGFKVGAIQSGSNRGLFRAVLRDAGRPLRAQEIWEGAVARGAATISTNPVNATHGSLVAMLGKGVKKHAKGLYLYDPETAPNEDEAPVET